jgi:hypothetical protein
VATSLALSLLDPDLDPIPDYVEPLEAWRVWRVGMLQGRVVLKSLFIGTVWEPGVPLSASCTQRHRSRLRPWRIEPSDHAPPEMGCRCGIYGVQSVVAARSYLERPDLLCRGERVIGRVALWGTVVEGQLGWRASRAYPIELFVPAPAVVRSGLRRRAYVDEILRALEDYRVPVDVVEPNVLAAL